MWRMAVVAVLVAGVYFGLPKSSRHQQPDIDTFGDPWTLSKVVADLRQAGVEVQLEPARTLKESRSGWCLRSPAFGASGSIGGYPGYILIYPNTARRLALWPEYGGPEVFPAGGCARIPEQHAWGAGNAVVFVDTWSAGYAQKFEDVRGAVLALRGE